MSVRPAPSFREALLTLGPDEYASTPNVPLMVSAIVVEPFVSPLVETEDIDDELSSPLMVVTITMFPSPTSIRLLSRAPTPFRVLPLLLLPDSSSKESRQTAIGLSNKASVVADLNTLFSSAPIFSSINS